MPPPQLHPPATMSAKTWESSCFTVKCTLEAISESSVGSHFLKEQNKIKVVVSTRSWSFIHVQQKLTEMLFDAMLPSVSQQTMRSEQ